MEQTKLTSKKRNGVVHFIKYFPVYVSRVESQLINADTLEIRQNVDVAYEKIVQTMFDSLKQMAKMDGEGEDKGQLNYHVILIGGPPFISFCPVQALVLKSPGQRTCTTLWPRFGSRRLAPSWRFLSAPRRCTTRI